MKTPILKNLKKLPENNNPNSLMLISFSGIAVKDFDPNESTVLGYGMYQ